MRSAIIALTTAVPALVCGPAAAEIIVHRAEYAAGVLVVSGEASEPHQVLTLDDRYNTTADRNKDFTFRIRYLPRDCMIRIEAGQEVRPAMVKNCLAATDMGDSIRAATNRATPNRAKTNRDKAEQREGKRQSEERSDFAGVSEDASEATTLRVVRQPCEAGQECRVTCREDEFAINAFCPTGSAKLLSERTVSCGAGAVANIVAYCAFPEADD